MIGRHWVWRGALPIAIAAGVLVGGSAAHLDPEPVRVVLLAMLGVFGVGVLLDSAVGEPAQWGEHVVRPTRVHGRDTRTAAHLRALEDHYAAREPTPVVRDRLAALADGALQSRHGVSRHSPEGRALLGPRACEFLDGPAHRATPHQIERCIDRIEQL